MAAAPGKGLPGPPLRSPPPAWPLRGLCLALGVSLVQAIGDRGGEPRWWRLRCNGTTAERWRLCNVRFFSDPLCTRAPAAQLLRRTHSSEEKRTYGVPLDVVFTEFSSACEQCDPGEVYLGVEFSAPVVVQCVRFTECPDSVPTTPPPTTQEAAPTTTGAPSTTTVTSYTGPTTTDWRNALADLLEDSFGGARRLGSASSCPSLLLERSVREQDGWLWVAEWSPPQAGVGLSLNAAEQRVLQQPPQVESWNPAAISCGDCGRAHVDGIPDRHTLTVTFSEQIHWGPGHVLLDRGSLGQTLLDPALDSNWFRVLGNRLLIVPQVPMGESSACTSISFQAQALQDADGAFFAQGSPYTICMADIVPPKLMQTDPPAGEVNVRLLPQIRLEFDEEVMMHLMPAPIQLVPQGSSAATVTISVADQSQVRFSSCSTCAMRGLVEIMLTTPLEPETGYELRVPATSISDTSGNAFAGYAMAFTTECPASGCSPTGAPTPAPTPAGEEQPTEEESNIPLYLGIVAGVICCGAGTLAGWKYYVRAYVLPSRELPKAGTVPTAPTPAWTAKEAASTTGWRKPQPGPMQSAVNTAPDVKGIPQGFANINISVQSLNGSGTWGTTNSAASRVTATTTASTTTGPRAAGAAGAGETATKAGSPAGPAATKPPTEPTQKGRAQTEEDIKKNPSNASGPSAAGGTSFNDDNTTAGGWVRAVDSATGRNYWYHYKTRETRWDDPRTGPPAPPRAKPSAAPEGPPPPGSVPPGDGRGPEPKASGPNPPPRGHAKPEAKAPPAAPKAAAPPPENTRAGRVKADILQQLEKTKGEDIASRKKTFRFLCLQWHPDKNQEDAELATEVFQFMQLQRDWYLKE